MEGGRLSLSLGPRWVKTARNSLFSLLYSLSLLGPLSSPCLDPSTPSPFPSDGGRGGGPGREGKIRDLAGYRETILRNKQLFSLPALYRHFYPFSQSVKVRGGRVVRVSNRLLQAASKSVPFFLSFPPHLSRPPPPLRREEREEGARER